MAVELIEKLDYWAFLLEKMFWGSRQVQDSQNNHAHWLKRTVITDLKTCLLLKSNIHFVLIK